MQVLIVGNGGREHALAWKVAQSSIVDRVWVAPGNAGIAMEPGCGNVDLAVDDFSGLVDFVRKRDVELTIVGPEVPLVAGIRDHFDAEGLACFGPSARAAKLEGSKAFTKDFLARHGIPSGAYRTFTDLFEAEAYIRQRGAPIVVKADGLAAGKGVIVAATEAEALSAARDMLSGNVFGEAGHSVVIEEFLEGEEASFICVSDGRHVVPFASSQDHKARDDGDRGPNTGGMGAYSPAPVVTPAVHERIMRTVIMPTVNGMAADGVPYVGFLYAGLMIDPKGQPRVIEFNCRFGDPEAEPVLMRLRSDLVTLCQRTLAGELDQVSLEWDDRSALGVVMAAGGYPLDYHKGDVINGLPEPGREVADVKVFHAGTVAQDHQVLTNGGRVLCVTALGEGVAEAQRAAYQMVSGISWDHHYFRRDIGYRAIGRDRNG